ncbi:uncharacterized protein LOC119099438 [Pollicipes pollicipes]|uniref:uncharacterized protein LOC119099438 n=1 Tax=Pollicipes pollicipes TaxID=41117 RepID=UPI0018858117|nr:uncharacterized protein LOC119099438 [Pollicipes pollicipes]
MEVSKIGFTLTLLMAAAGSVRALPANTAAMQGWPAWGSVQNPTAVQAPEVNRAGSSSIGIGDGCGSGPRGECVGTCCTRLGDGAARCPGTLVFVADAGACVDCLFQPHPSCPRLAAGVGRLFGGR